MNQLKLLLSLLVVVGMFGYGDVGMSAEGAAVKVKGVKPGVISAVALNKAGTYCHMKFPAIKPETLHSAKPQLQDAKTGEIIDFYGPCDYDPVGYDEVCKQKAINAKRDSPSVCE